MQNVFYQVIQFGLNGQECKLRPKRLFLVLVQQAKPALRKSFSHELNGYSQAGRGLLLRPKRYMRYKYI